MLNFAFKKYFFIFLTFVFFLSSCSGANPVIYKLEHTLQVYWNYPQEFNERLLIELLADDEDGFDEIYEVYIINDKSEQYWRINKDEWDLLEENGKNWIILNNIVEVENKNLPRGKYRIILMDFSGYRDEQSFTINNPVINYRKNELPTFGIIGNGEFKPIVYNFSDTEDKMYLEIAHPTPQIDIAGNPDNVEFNKAVAPLGPNGVYYRISQHQPIKFISEFSYSRFNIFLHVKKANSLLYTSGPYEVVFTR